MPIYWLGSLLIWASKPTVAVAIVAMTYDMVKCIL